MGIINWARSRFNGRTESKRFDLEAASQPERWQVAPEETNEQQQWRSHQDQTEGFLSIGTLGNVIDHPPEEDHPASTPDLLEFTVEEAEELQEALAKLLRRAKSKSGASRAEDGLSLPLDRFLNCPSSLEVDRRVLRKRDEENDDAEGDCDLSPNTKIILSMAKDLLVNTGNSRGSSNKNKSFKFLLRKMFVCDAPSSSLKDPVESRMDKFFRTVLGKKINVRPSSNTPAKSRYLEDRPNGKSRRADRSRQEVDGEEEDCCRWDRTDSEFIVLEI